MICSERDDRPGSLEDSAVAVMGNLRSTVRLRTSRTDRVGDRGTPKVEVKWSIETESDKEFGNVEERDDVMQLE